MYTLIRNDKYVGTTKFISELPSLLQENNNIILYCYSSILSLDYKFLYLIGPLLGHTPLRSQYN